MMMMMFLSFHSLDEWWESDCLFACVCVFACVLCCVVCCDWIKGDWDYYNITKPSWSSSSSPIKEVDSVELSSLEAFLRRQQESDCWLSFDNLLAELEVSSTASSDSCELNIRFVFRCSNREIGNVVVFVASNSWSSLIWRLARKATLSARQLFTADGRR